ncbi:MAG TPA: sigma-70 family RNA polymerase sigma factor [Verrucomicrobiae bacterium]|jgi:RNA polymerase sigma-70 factor (ECF subfamily)|nr:sigma-70 family RNA polymerase sigma factor [Verrucomicrobiae bacterium]
MNLAATCDLGSHSFWSFFDQPLAMSRMDHVTEARTANHEHEIDLLRRISDGDRAAFGEFYDLYSSLLFSVAVKILRDQKEAEDVLQDVFVQIWEKARSFDSRLGKPSSWAVTFVRNKSIDRIRASQRRSRLVEDATAEIAPLQADAPTANDTVCGKEKAEVIRSAVINLPTEQRQAIEMAFFSGLTQNEISERLREPLGTIKARIRRGMLKLREKLEGRL